MEGQRSCQPTLLSPSETPLLIHIKQRRGEEKRIRGGGRREGGVERGSGEDWRRRGERVVERMKRGELEETE